MHTRTANRLRQRALGKERVAGYNASRRSDSPPDASERHPGVHESCLTDDHSGDPSEECISNSTLKPQRGRRCFSLELRVVLGEPVPHESSTASTSPALPSVTEAPT